jgi:hypothetical protein
MQSLTPKEEKDLSIFLPREEEPPSTPPWVKQFKVPKTKQCVNPECTRKIITLTNDNSQLTAIITEGQRSYWLTALLPKYMGYAYDEYYDQWFSVAFHNGKLIAAADNLKHLIMVLKEESHPSFILGNIGKYLRLLEPILPRVTQVVSAGLTDDTIIDPRGALDTKDYGAEPLLRVFNWVTRYYGANARWAWFNVMALTAKLITPIIRHRNSTFNDQVVYNAGRGGEGKTTLVNHALLPLLGGDEANRAYILAFGGFLGWEDANAELRALIGLNRLPLILDEQIFLDQLVKNRGIFLSALEAPKYTQFKNLRGIIAFVDMPFKAFLEKVIGSTNTAVERRFIAIQWLNESVDEAAFSNLPEVKPILGFTLRLWQKYRSELAKSSNLLDLVEKLAIAIGREYQGDKNVEWMVKYTLNIVDELRRQRQSGEAVLSDDELLVNRAREYTARKLGVSQVSAIEALLYVLKNQQEAGIKLATLRSANRVEELKSGLLRVIEGLPSEPAFSELRQLLMDAYNSGKVVVIVFARSPLMPDARRMFLGSSISTYSVDGVRRHGYPIPLGRFVEIFLSRTTP